MTSTQPIPISKKCGLCKTIKLLNEFEIDEKKKDKHAAICKECIAKHQPSICTCSCDRCIDGKIVKTALPSMELLLTRIENGLELSEDMLIMITSLAYSAGILCEKCEAELGE
jgi:hypothetical protein